MINLKVDPYNDEIANDEDLITSVDSSDAKMTAYIVKAVNNHDALVKLAHDLLNCLKDEDDTFDLKYEARKILAKLAI